MSNSRLATALQITGKFLLVVFRIIVAIITWLVKCLAKFPNAMICSIVGAAVTFGLYHLPGFLMYLGYLGAFGTLILVIRGAWTDLTVTSAENRIAARTVETISKATNQDQQP